MGLLGSALEKATGAADWLLDSSLSLPRNLLWNWPGNAINWTRDRVNNVLMSSKRTEDKGARADKRWAKPTAEAVDRFFGAGPIEEAEGVPFWRSSDTREKYSGYAKAANRIDRNEAEAAIRHEELLAQHFKDSADKELSIEKPDPTLTERAVLKYVTERINARRENPLQLLSSVHPLTDIAQKRAKLLNSFPSTKNLADVQLLRYSILERGQDPDRKDGKDVYHEVLHGDVHFTRKGKPRFDISAKDRMRALEPPKISEDRQHFDCLLEETDDHYSQRCIARQQERKNLQAFPFSMTVRVGQPGYPEGGDPYLLFEHFYDRYRDHLIDPAWNQVALGIFRSGESITIAGMLSKDRPVVPEPLPEPHLPVRFNDQYWFNRIPAAERAHDSDPQKLFDHPQFGNGYSVWNFARLQKNVQALNNEHYSVSIQGVSLQPDDPASFSLFPTKDPDHPNRRNTVNIQLQVNKKTYLVKLIWGTDMLILPEDCPLLDQKNRDSEVQNTHVTVDECIQMLEVMKNNHAFSRDSIQISGHAPAPPPPAPPQAGGDE